MKLKRGIAVAALVVGMLAIGASPAQAFGGGSTLTVISYFDGAGDLVGQTWFGCPGQSGSWGVKSNIQRLTTPPC